jgi:sec-independent protein translocase protein TatA
MPDMGGWEWMILAIVALLLFSGSRLADVGRNVGRAIREFKEETSAPAAGTDPAQPTPPASDGS